jgi:hypothetical protein
MQFARSADELLDESCGERGDQALRVHVEVKRMDDTGRDHRDARTTSAHSLIIQLSLNATRLQHHNLVQIPMSMRPDCPIVQTAACGNGFNVYRRFIGRLWRLAIKEERRNRRRRRNCRSKRHVGKVQLLQRPVHSFRGANRRAYDLAGKLVGRS